MMKTNKFYTFYYDISSRFLVVDPKKLEKFSANGKLFLSQEDALYSTLWICLDYPWQILSGLDEVAVGTLQPVMLNSCEVVQDIAEEEEWISENLKSQVRSSLPHEAVSVAKWRS